MTRSARFVRLTGWAMLLAGALALLHATAHGTLAAPPLTRPTQWPAWLRARPPIAATMALIRLGVEVAVCYLATITLAGVVARAVGAHALARLIDRLTVAPVRRLLTGALGAGVVLTTLPGPACVTAPAPQSATPGAAPASTITMQRLPDLSAAPAAAAPAPPRPLAPAAPPGDPRPGPVAELVWRVEPGECFWTKAAAVLTRHYRRAPTDAEVVPYWERLIATNRDRLVDRDDADRIYPGQVFSLPPLPPLPPPPQTRPPP